MLELNMISAEMISVYVINNCQMLIESIDRLIWKKYFKQLKNINGIYSMINLPVKGQ